jgi:flagellar motor switch protein FliG
VSKEKNLNEAHRFLREALGAEKGDALYRKVPKSGGKQGDIQHSSFPFDFLEDFSASQLGLFFRDESPAAEALVLSRLPSKLTAEVLANTGPEQKAELVRRIARMGETSPEVLERAAVALREKARRFSLSANPEDEIEIDGMGALTAILKASEADFGGRLIGELEHEDPGLSRSLREKYFSLEDASMLPDRVMEEKLISLSDRDIILLLKNPPESFKQKIIANLSEGREQRIKEEAEYLGPVAKIEVEAAVRDFLAWFRSTGPWLE